ncbi:MAG: glucose/arabinose dehydrogenase [Saprospiraceae bacterium]
MPIDAADSIRIKFGGDNAAYFQILLDPDFKDNQRVFRSYAAKGIGGTTMQVISATYEDYHLSNHKVLLTGRPYSKDRVHYGGGMIIGGDEKLYIVVGERYFREIDQPEMPVSQDYMDRRGKMYRINLDGTIPDDNPKWEEETIPGLYALGISATQGLTLSPNGQDIWFIDHGTRQGDEVNKLERKLTMVGQ